MTIGHETKRELGRQIKVLRAARGFSQNTLADESGVQRTYIALIESGRMLPTPDQLARIKAALSWNDKAEQALAVLAQPTESPA